MKSLRLPTTTPSKEYIFILNAIKTSKLRLDGRQLTEARICDIQPRRNPIDSHSICKVNIGGTIAICDVGGELVKPYPDRPNEGMLQIIVGYSFTASPSKASSPSSTDGKLQLLEATMQRSRAVDLESLCVVAGKLVWSIKCVVTVVNDCGSALDASSLALMAGLLHYRRNDITCVGEEVTIHPLEERVPIPLSILHIPLAISIAMLTPTTTTATTTTSSSITTDNNPLNENDDQILINRDDFYYLVDPTHREEAIANGMFSVILNAHKEVCGLSKSGEPSLDPEMMTNLVQVAATIRKTRGEILDKAIIESPFF
jgi:exosome complex component RRP45